MLKYIVIILGVSLLLSIGLFFSLLQLDYSNSFFEKISFSIQGKVINIEDKGRYDIVRIELISSDIYCFDSYTEYGVLFTRIGLNEAEIILRATNIALGDELVLLGGNNQLIVKRDNQIKYSMPLYISPFTFLSIQDEDFSVNAKCSLSSGAI
jgi:hypothetical protein